MDSAVPGSCVTVYLHQISFLDHSRKPYPNDELASETPTVNLNLEFSVVIYFEKFKVFSSSDKLPRTSMPMHLDVGIWRTQIKVKYMYTIQ